MGARARPYLEIRAGPLVPVGHDIAGGHGSARDALACLREPLRQSLGAVAVKEPPLRWVRPIRAPLSTPAAPAAAAPLASFELLELPPDSSYPHRRRRWPAASGSPSGDARDAVTDRAAEVAERVADPAWSARRAPRRTWSPARRSGRSTSTAEPAVSSSPLTSSGFSSSVSSRSGPGCCRCSPAGP